MGVTRLSFQSAAEALSELKLMKQETVTKLCMLQRVFA